MKTITEIPEDYQTAKKRHSDELNEFEGIFFAFSNEQFNKGMRKIGLEPEETSKIFKLAGGGFIRKDRSKAFKDMFKRQELEMKALRKAKRFLLDSLVYELQNHEYCITYRAQDALDALGLDRSELPTGLLKKACKLALEGSEA